MTRKRLPKPLPDPDFTALKATANQHLDTIRKGDGVDTDDQHYIYEAAMEALYGKDVWKWINKYCN